MLVLVTGGAGFIGSHVVDTLLAAGHDVRIADHLHPAAHDREPDYVADVEWLRDDLRAGAERAVKGVDAVCHQAAMVGLGVDLADIADYVSHNASGTAELLRALHARGFDGRIVLASSMVVYGEGRYACPVDGDQPAPPRAPADLDAGRFEPSCPVCGGPLEPRSVPESAPADPRNVYAATKLHQEHLTIAYARETGADAIALRYHNVYGPRMPRDTPYAGVASIFRSRLEAGEAPLVTEDGNQLRDFVHVRDIATANRLALESMRHRRLQRRQRRAPQRGGHGRGAQHRHERPAASGHRHLARRRRPPRFRLHRPHPRRARLRAVDRLHRRHDRVRHRRAALMHPDWLGSPQHFIAGVILTAGVVVVFRNRISPSWLLAAFAVGVTAAAELVIELVEYPLLYSDDVNATAYLDTLADLAATLAGAILTAAAAFGLLQRSSGSGDSGV